jgi:hypothetical protein
MIKKILLIIFLFFIASVLVMPFALPNCGTNGFHVGFPVKTDSCQEPIKLSHFKEMIDFLLSGNVTSIVLLAAVIFVIVIFNFFDKIKILELPVLKNIFSRVAIGKLKPFDELLLALKRGIIYPKTFCQA